MAAGDLVTKEIRGKLGRLRRAIRLHLVGEGASWVVLALAGLVVVTLLGDWGLNRLTHQPVHRAQRALILALCLAGVAYVAWRFAFRRALMRLGDDDLALVVEHRYPQLQDRLIGAVQFSRRSWSAEPWHSPAMIVRMARQANEQAQPLDFAASVNWPRMRRVALGALAAVLALAALSLAQPKMMRLWFQRNVLFSDAPWPRQTYLRVLGGPTFTVVRDGDLDVAVEVEPKSTVTPDQVVFHMDYRSVGKVEEVVRAEPGKGVFVKKFQGVSEPFDFYVTGNDDRTALCRVNMVEPPELRRVEFLVHYPYYMNLPDHRFDGMTGVLAAPPGSEITIVAEATKPLSRAQLMLDGHPAGKLEIREVHFSDQAAAPAGCGLAGYFRLTPPVAGQKRFSLRFDLTDAKGFANREGNRFEVQVLYDQPPKLKVAWLGLGKNVTAKAKIPLEIDAQDDYGLTRLTGLVRLPDQPNKPLQTDLLDLSKPVRHVHLPQSPGGEVLIDLASLPGQPVKQGQTIGLAVEAADSMPPAPATRPASGPASRSAAALATRSASRPAQAESYGDGPNVTVSEYREFHVVSERELLDDLLRQQQALRLRMLQAVQTELAARDRMAGGRDQAQANNPAEARRLAKESLANQQNAGLLCSTILQSYRDIYSIMKYNLGYRPETQKDLQRLQDKIIDPLAQLLNGAMKQVRVDADAALALPDAALAGRLGQLVDAQQKIHDKLNAIMGQMAQLESIQELARRIAYIIEICQEVRHGITTSARERASSLFNPTTQPGPGN